MLKTEHNLLKANHYLLATDHNLFKLTTFYYKTNYILINSQPA